MLADALSGVTKANANGCAAFGLNRCTAAGALSASKAMSQVPAAWPSTLPGVLNCAASDTSLILCQPNGTLKKALAPESET